MPSFNELGRGKLSVAVAKLLGVNDDGAVRSLSPEISTVIQLPVSVEELMGAGGWGRWSSGFFTTAVAGQGPRIRFRNPANSGVIVILEGASFSSGLGGTWGLDAGYSDVGNQANTPSIDFRDGRLNPRGSAVVNVSWTTQVGVFAPSGWCAQAPAGVTMFYSAAPAILLPGNCFDFIHDGVNTVAACNFWWRERGATAAERAL